MAVYDLTKTTPTTLVTGDIINCPYSGTIKSITLQKGIYKFEAWGGSTVGFGAAKGGYSTGTLTNAAATTYYLVTGGAGTYASYGSTASGGYNGGGNGGPIGGLLYQYQSCSGAGASHISTMSGLLSTLSGSTSSIMIVAGGAGAGQYESSDYTKETAESGHGGGSSGVNGSRVKMTDASGVYTYCTASGGGGQSSGGAGGISMYASGSGKHTGSAGSFGQGGSGCTDTSTYIGTTIYFGGGGGGGGYYGGGGGSSSYNKTAIKTSMKCCGVAGAGGSGYVSSILTDASTSAGTSSSTFPDDSLNGYLRITVIKAGSLDVLINKEGTWKETDEMKINYNGTWKDADEIKINKEGTWKSQ